MTEVVLQGVAVVGTILAAVIAYDALSKGDCNFEQSPTTRVATPYSGAEEMIVPCLAANAQGYVAGVAGTIARAKEEWIGCEGRYCEERYSSAADTLTSYSSQ